MTADELRGARLLHITSVPMTLGFLRGQVGYMRSHGMEVAAMSSPGELFDIFEREQGIPSYRVQIHRKITPLQDLKTLHGIRRVIRSFKPDILHAHTPKAGLLGMLAATTCGTPVRIYHVHGLLIGHRLGKLLKVTEKLSCGRANRVLCVSHAARQVYIDEGLSPESKIKVFCNGSINGIDAAGQFNPQGSLSLGRELRQSLGIPATAELVGFVGRVVRDKGIVELEEAWRDVRRRYPGAHLIIAGPLEEQDPLPSETLKAFERDERVHLMGLVKDPRPVYAAIDILVLPTYREGLPYTPLEAQSMEVPVVATLIPGCKEAIGDGETGTLVAPQDVPALVGALDAYLGDPALRKKHGQAGRRRMLDIFDPKAIWKATAEDYSKLLEQYGRARANRN